MGGALGLAILASLAASRTGSLLTSGDDARTALNGGYHAAFLAGAIFAVAAAVIGGVLLRATTAAPDRVDAAAPKAAIPVEVGCD
jgi:hypothetical protein